MRIITTLSPVRNKQGHTVSLSLHVAKRAMCSDLAQCYHTIFSHYAIIGRRLDEAITYLVTEQLLWVIEVECMCVCVVLVLSVCVCVCVCVCLSSRQQMELHTNWVEISGRF